MSTITSDSVFMSTLQPHGSVTTYGLPSEVALGSSGAAADHEARARRVQQQVQMRLAEKGTLPRQNGSAGNYAMSDYGSGSASSSVKYNTFNPSFSSKSSYMYSGSRTMGPRVAQRGGFSCRSAGPDFQFHRISVGGGGGGGGGGVVVGGGGGGYYRDEMRVGGFQTSRPQSRLDGETVCTTSMLRQHTAPAPWSMVDNSDAGSMMSDREATFGRQYAHSAVNGYTCVMPQPGGFQGQMRRSLSGTLTRGGGGVGMPMGDIEMVQQPMYKGPAQRTISRITNRNRMSMGSMSSSMQQQVSSGGSVYGGDRPDGGFIMPGVSSASQSNLAIRPGTLSRAMSVKSMQSVGRGADIFGGQMEIGASQTNLSGINALDMAMAIQNLQESDPELQVLGAAYIQHECYNDSDSKNEVRRLKGIKELVTLFNSDNQEVQRYATGATRNLIYENMENKVALIEEGGIPQLVEALKEPDDELRKNITGILWNLSSKDNLKQKLARETLNELTDQILIPLTNSGNAEHINQTQSESEIFYNTTGCLRNMSSVNDKTRQQMRELPGLVDSLVGYIKAMLEDGKAEDKGVENAVCVLRNLSYQLYGEMPPSALLRLDGPTRGQEPSKAEAMGCFTPQSRKAKNRKNQELSTFTEVARVPKGMEWLWHPQILGVYNNVLKQCEVNSTTREAAAGALQNITAGDKRWASVLSRVALEQERMLPVVLDLLRTENDMELRSLTGFLRNLARHARDKNDMATKVVNQMVAKLPDDGNQKNPSSEVVINICGVLNSLVTSSSLAARDITFFDGLPKLTGIKNSHNNSPMKLKAAKAASTVLINMFQYKKLHSTYKQKGFQRQDFAEMTI